MDRLPTNKGELYAEATRLRKYLADDSYDSDIAGAYWDNSMREALLRLTAIEKTLGYLSSLENDT